MEHRRRKDMLSFRLPPGTAQHLRDMAEFYGSQATVIVVAVDRLWHEYERHQDAIESLSPPGGPGASDN